MKLIFHLSAVLVFLFNLDGFGQAGITYDIKKPEKYENRKLGYEKTTETKFKVPRRFIQNTVTHYNYFFNANNKLNEILARAKALNRDDFSKLLPFYNYSLEVTAASRRDLDSIIDKCTTAILIHDLRNDWVDNLYMLMGRAYYYRKQFDTAYITFQFVNHAFAPKEEEGYPKPIASNANADEGGNAYIVSTNEKRNIVKRTFSLPPSRNESLIWQVRTFIAGKQLTQAGVLIEILKRDPQFPPRLEPDLQEVEALWFYTQDMYDSAAIHLEKALNNAQSQAERARWEYLIAQLYERADKPVASMQYYEKAVQHTYDPVLDVYARLNSIKQNRGNAGEDYIQKNIDALNKLGRKEIYAEYRDIIYYTAAQMELQRNQKAAAIAFLEKSARYTLPNTPQRNKTYLQLGDMAFEARKYRAAKQYYDSVTIFDPKEFDNMTQLVDRKTGLQKIVAQMDIIDRQDSLLKIVAMQPEERDAYIRKLVRAMRKQQGLAEEEQQGGQNPSFGNSGNAPTDLFSTSSSGEWYFYNTSIKSKGFNDFRSKWGNRPNVDNWQVASMSSRQGLSADRGLPGQAIALDNAARGGAAKPISFESLKDNLPLTPEKYQKTRDSLEQALFRLGKIYQDALPDYVAAIGAYDTLLTQFANTRLREETLFNEYYCYKKIGDENNARRILELIRLQYPDGKYMHLINDPQSVKYSENAARADVTRRYERIYNAFIEGDFEQALAQKKVADSLYGESYWTPQLLYIESVYFIHERKDNQAIIELNHIINKYPNTGMALKAKNILSVLARRKQIEDYLTNLKIERATDSVDSANQLAARNVPARKDSVQSADSSVALSKRITNVPGAGQPARPDAGKLGIGKISLNPAQLEKIKVDSAKLAMLQRKSDSIQMAQTKAKNDAARLALLKKQNDSIQAAIKKIRSDSTTAAAARIAALKTAFSYSPDQPHQVLILLNKVDPVYVTETRNAFGRYNKENYYNKPLQIVNSALDDSLKLVLIRGFDNAAEALDYMDKARKLAGSEIIPWLPAGKYSFLIITDQNLDILQGNKDLENYRKFLATYYPGRF